MEEQRQAAVAEAAGRHRWSEADARVLIDASRQSGRTLTAFARRYDVHPERLARWNRLLRSEPQEAVQFHPVRVREVGLRSGEPDDRIEVVFSAGRSVRVPHGFDAEDLRRVLAVVEAGEMMFTLPASVRIYVAAHPVDMRRSFDGLAAATRSIIGADPLSGHVFAFLNRRRNSIKLLVWDRTGFFANL